MLEVDGKLSFHCPAILQPEFRSFSLRLFREWERGGGANFPAFQKDSLPSEGRDQPAKALPLGPEEQPNNR